MKRKGSLIAALLFSAMIMFSFAGCDMSGISGTQQTESSAEQSSEMDEVSDSDIHEKPEVEVTSDDDSSDESKESSKESSKKTSKESSKTASKSETSKKSSSESSKKTSTAQTSKKASEEEKEEPEKKGSFDNMSYWMENDGEIRITGLASISDKNLKYCFQFRRTTNKKWNLIGEKYSGKATASFTPEDGVTYEVRVRIKDSDDGVVEKKFKVSTDMFGLENTTKIKDKEIKKGTSMKISAKAEGGSEPYTYAYYFKRSSNDIWNPIGSEFGKDTSAKLKPEDTGKYDIRVFVKDSNQQAAIKEFTINVK